MSQLAPRAYLHRSPSIRFESKELLAAFRPSILTPNHHCLLIIALNGWCAIQVTHCGPALFQQASQGMKSYLFLPFASSPQMLHSMRAPPVSGA